jgi:hypothetical protein
LGESRSGGVRLAFPRGVKVRLFIFRLVLAVLILLALLAREGTAQLSTAVGWGFADLPGTPVSRDLNAAVGATAAEPPLTD